MRIPLEDQIQDIVGKARRGLKLSESQLAQKAGIGLDDLEAFLGGRSDGSGAENIAHVLGLDSEALAAIARDTWYPETGPLPATFAAFNTQFEDLTVNAYLVWQRDGGPAAAFDTGGDCTAMLETLGAHKLDLEAVFLTHTHYDHVADLDDLLAHFPGAKAYVSDREKLPKALAIHAGQDFPIGGLRVHARLTPGHSAGGMTYVVEGLDRTIAVVGDALFAGSMGGVPPELYASALRANRENILSLPDSTFICPGHGPLTTVGEEKRHNPFYAGSV